MLPRTEHQQGRDTHFIVRESGKFSCEIYQKISCEILYNFHTILISGRVHEYFPANGKLLGRGLIKNFASVVCFVIFSDAVNHNFLLSDCCFVFMSILQPHVTDGAWFEHWRGWSIGFDPKSCFDHW